MLREDFAQAEARGLSVEGVLAFAQRLSGHIRKEERQLFERMQELMSKEEIAALGAILEETFKDAALVCALPTRSQDRRSN
jgi:hemerythrin-like domain-containing protein